MSTTTNVNQVKLNIMTQAQYNSITPSATELYAITDANPVTSTNITDALGYTPQAQLTSGTNIKTINGNSILGSGNLQTPYRNIGEIVASTIPLTDAGLHLLDGSLIQGSGIYSDFVDYIAGIYDASASYFCTEAEWQTSVTTYGVCGKFVYDSVNNTVRLPKVTGIIEGTVDVTALGDLVEAGLPNITGTTGWFCPSSTQIRTGAFTRGDTASVCNNNGTTNAPNTKFDASLSNPIYGNSSTVQPQAIKYYYYIVIATSTKTDIQVDIDEVVTDLNGKADVDLSNCTKPHIVETYVNGTSWYRVYSDGWCEQGGYIGSGSGNATVTLLKLYKDTNYYANGCAITNNTGLGSDGNVGVKTTTTCSFVNNAYTYPMLWECKGYIN